MSITTNTPRLAPHRKVTVKSDARPDRDRVVEITLTSDISYSNVVSVSRAEALQLITALASYLAATTEIVTA